MTYEEFEASFLDELKPKGREETALFQSFVEAAWKLRLLAEQEKQLSRKADGEALLSEAAAVRKEVYRLHRLQTRTEAIFHRSLNRLKKLQEARARSPRPGKDSTEMLREMETPPHIM